MNLDENSGIVSKVHQPVQICINIWYHEIWTNISFFSSYFKRISVNNFFQWKYIDANNDENWKQPVSKYFSLFRSWEKSAAIYIWLFSFCCSTALKKSAFYDSNIFLSQDIIRFLIVQLPLFHRSIPLFHGSIL